MMAGRARRGRAQEGVSWELGRLPADSGIWTREGMRGRLWQTEGKLVQVHGNAVLAVSSQGRWREHLGQREEMRLSGTGCGLPFLREGGGPLGGGVLGKISFAYNIAVLDYLTIF